MINGYAQVDLSTVEFTEDNLGVISVEIFNKFSTGKPMFITGTLKDVEVSGLMYPLHDTKLLETASEGTIVNLYAECDLSYVYWGSLHAISKPESSVNTKISLNSTLFFCGRILNPETGLYIYTFAYIVGL